MGADHVRVLIADDQRLFAEALEAILSTDARIKVVGRAADGSGAVDLAREHQPDVVLMDIAMPVMDGIEATKAIREHAETESIPIIALSAYGDLYREKALAAGCNDVVQKPVDFERLQKLVEQNVA